MLKLFSILFFCNSFKSIPAADTPSYTVIRNVNIVDVIKGRIITHKTVIVKDSLISVIFSNNNNNPAYPVNARIIDGTDKFLMPGLWDMHFHIAWDNSNDTALFELLLKYGITGIRDMGGSLSILNKFKKEIKEDPGASPEIFGAGPIIDGNPPVHKDFSLPVDSLTDLEYQLDSLVRNGVDFFKVYSLLRQPELEEISNYSKTSHIPFAGHLSEYTEPEASIKLGQKSIEHFNRLEDIWLIDKKRMSNIAKLMRNNNTWLCPTIITYFLKLHMIDPSIVNNSLEKYINPELKKEWLTARESRRKKLNAKELLSKQEELFKQQNALLFFFYSKKIKLLAGSDFAGMPFVYPGIGLHQELELMVKSGIPVAEVLKSATINPALYFGIENKNGSVEAGKYADLLLLGENPLIDIRNTLTITRVFKRGKETWFVQQ
jgi:imidazolonepropionase-like amidohydrolase